MKTFIIQLSIVIMTFSSCHEIGKETSKQRPDHSQLPAPPTSNPTWVDSGKVNLRLDTTLKHDEGGFSVDSVLLIFYKGSSGEIIYELLNKEGKWLDSIYSIKKLSVENIKGIHAILGSTTLSNIDFQLCCFDPQIGLVFFRNGNVIAHSAISVENLKVQSTSVLGNRSHSAAIDTNLVKDLKHLIESPK